MKSNGIFLWVFTVLLYTVVIYGMVIAMKRIVEWLSTLGL